MAQTTTIRNLLVRLGVDADDRGAMSFDRAVKGVRRTMLAAAAAAAALGGSLFEIARRTANAGDESAKAAVRIGTTAEAVQELSFAADITGTSFAEMETGIRRMTRVVRDADRGMASAQDAISDLGVETKDSNGEFRDSVDLFEESIDALLNIESSVERAALAQDVFGRSGTRLLTIAERGGVTLGELREEARDLGIVMSNDAAAASEEFNDSLTRLRAVLGGIRNQIGIALIPSITNAVNRVREWFQANRQIIQQAVDRAIQRVAAAMRAVVGTAREVIEQIDDLVRRTVGWDAVLSTVAATLTTLAAMKVWGILAASIKVVIGIVGLLSIKVVAIAAAFIALVLIVQDLITYFRGGESVTGRLIDKFTELEIVETVRSWFSDLVETVREMWATFMDGRAGRFLDILQEFREIVADALMPVLIQLRDLAQSIWEAFTLYINLVWAVFSRVAQAVFNVWWRYVNMVLSVARRVFTAIADVVMWWWENIALPVFRAIAPIVSMVLSNVVGFFQTAFDSIKDVLEFFLALVNGEFDSFSEIVDAALGVARRHVTRFGDFFLSLITDRVDAVRGVFSSAIDWIMNKIAGVTNRFDSARDTVAKVPGLGFLGTDDGAADDAATGSRQRSQQNAAMAASFGDTTIQVDGANADADSLADRIAERQEAIYQRRLRQATAAFNGGDI